MNKQLFHLAMVAALAFLAGCGIAVIDGDPTGAMNNGGLESGTTTASGSTSSDTPSTTETGTETSTETGTETMVETELIVTQQPIEEPSTSALVKIMRFAFYAPKHSVQVDSSEFGIASTDGAGLVKGTGGTSYIWYNQIADAVTSDTVAGPLEIDAPNGAKSAKIAFTHSFLVEKGQTLQLEFVCAFSFTEDYPGEFIGHDYQISLRLKEITGKVVELGVPLIPEMISPETDPAQQFHVVQ